MALTPHDVSRLADLARIELTDDELAELAPQLDVILNAVAGVAEVADEDIPDITCRTDHQRLPVRCDEALVARRRDVAQRARRAGPTLPGASHP